MTSQTEELVRIPRDAKMKWIIQKNDKKGMNNLRWKEEKKKIQVKGRTFLGMNCFPRTKKIPLYVRGEFIIPYDKNANT